MLLARPSLRPFAAHEEMLRRNPDLSPGIRRILERRVCGWQGLHGPSAR